MPVHSVTIVDAVFGAQDPELAGCCRLQHAADNGLVAGSSPPGPTTQSCANPEFPVSAEHPRFSALWGGCNGPFAVSAGNEDRPESDWGPASLTPEIPFPGARRRPGQRLGSHATETSLHMSSGSAGFLRGS